MIGFHKSDGGIVMETIKERAEEFAQNFEIILKDVDCGGCGSCEKCKDYRRFVDIVIEIVNAIVGKVFEYSKKDNRPNV